MVDILTNQTQLKVKSHIYLLLEYNMLNQEFLKLLFREDVFWFISVNLRCDLILEKKNVSNSLA